MFSRNRDKSNANDAGNRDSMSVTSKTQNGGNLTKTLSKATMLLTGSGPPVYKQLKTAIMEGNEEKALAIYATREGTRIPLDQPFPTKKVENVQDTPVHLAAKYALARLLQMFLEYGGNPTILNSRCETALHSTCLLASFPLKRAELMETILRWELMRPDNVLEKVDVNSIDIDGNTALHLTSYNGMVQCIEVLIKRGAKLSIINKSNLSCCECADRGNFKPVGTMLELAWLFQPTNELQLATQQYNKFLTESSGGSVVLDSRSIALTGLIDFINHAIRITAETLGETAARAEVLLTEFCWDVKKLKKEYLSNTEKVLKATKLKPRTNGVNGTVQKKISLSDKDTDTIRVGLAVEDIYCDPCYLKVQTFTVYKDGARKSYSLQTYDGKVCVFPTGFDPSLRYLDDFGNNPQNQQSNVKPKKTEPCALCGEMMLEPCSIIHFISGNIVEPFKREIRCSSGHKFCFNCWSDHAQGHHAMGCIPCPEVECGEILDLQWAPMVLKRSELVNRLLTNRQQNVIKSLDLKLCPAPNCGLLVRILPHSTQKLNRSAGASRVAICGHGHAFCLNCFHEAHSPLQCPELTVWQELLRQESKVSTNTKDKKDKSAPQSLFVSPPTSKNCPSCDHIINKNEACNFVACTTCNKKLCWVCLKDWNTHIEGNTMLYCNQFIERVPKAMLNTPSNQAMAKEGEEKTDDVSLIQKKQKLLRQNKILHHFVRYMTHMQSQKLEHESRKATLSRILEGLRASQEGELIWLRSSTSANPLFEKEEDDHLPTIGYKEDALIADYQIPIEECIEFLSDGFDELEKARTFLKWSYPFALFEFDDKIVKGKKASPNRIPQKFDNFKVDFFFLQANLEYNTEVLSNILARRRIRGTKQEITLATLTLRAKRIQFEQLLQEYLTPPGSNFDEVSTPSDEAKRENAPVNGTAASNNNKSIYRGGSNLSFLISGPVPSDNNSAIPPNLNPPPPPSLLAAQQSNNSIPATIPASLHPTPSRILRQPETIPEPVEVVGIEQRIIAPKKDPDQEALEHAILLSKQEEEYGINMYDSLTPADEPNIAEYMEQGFTREEAILIIYEEKFGKVSIQSKEITPSLPTTIKSGGYHPLQDDPEVKRLMIRGYTKEQAIEIVSKKNHRKQAPHRVVPPMPSTLPSANITEEEAIRSLVACGYTREQALAMYHETRKDSRGPAHRDDTFHRTELLASTEINNTEAAISSWIARGYTREQAIHQVLLENQRQRGLAFGSHLPQGNSQSFHVPPAPAPSTSNYNIPVSSTSNYNMPKMSSYDEDEIAGMIARGFSREQAMQLTHRRMNTQSFDTHDPKSIASGSDITGFDAQVAHAYNNHSIYRASSLNSEQPNMSANFSSNYQPFSNNGHDVISPSSNRNFPGTSPAHSANNSAIYPPGSQSIFRAGGGNHSGYSPSPSQQPQMPNYSGSVFESSIAGEYVVNPRAFDMNFHQNNHNQHHHATTRPSEATMMEKSMLLMQQEAEFGINMYDSLTPADEPEINALIAQGYSNDDAVKMIFDRRYRPYDPKLQPLPTNQQAYFPSEHNNDSNVYQPPADPVGGYHHHHDDMSNRRGGGRSAATNSRGQQQQQQQHSSSSVGQEKKKVFRGAHLLGISSHSQEMEQEDPLQRTLRLSQFDKGPSASSTNSRSRNDAGNPLALSRPNPLSAKNNRLSTNSRSMGGYKQNDVKQLEKMGFTREEATQALIENDNDLHRAADVLLSYRASRR